MFHPVASHNQEAETLKIQDPTSILPDEAFLKIFQFLPDIDLLWASRVNRRWQTLSKDSTLTVPQPSIVSRVFQRRVLGEFYRYTCNTTIQAACLNILYVDNDYKCLDDGDGFTKVDTESGQTCHEDDYELAVASEKWIISYYRLTCVSKDHFFWDFIVSDGLDSWTLQTDIGCRYDSRSCTIERITGRIMVDDDHLLLVSYCAEFELWNLKKREKVQSVSYKSEFLKANRFIYKVYFIQKTVVVVGEKAGKDENCIFDLDTFKLCLDPLCGKLLNLYEQVNSNRAIRPHFFGSVLTSVIPDRASENPVIKTDWSTLCKDQTGSEYHQLVTLALNNRWIVVKGVRKGKKSPGDLIVFREDVGKEVLRLNKFSTKKRRRHKAFLTRDMLFFEGEKTYELCLVFLPKGIKETLILPKFKGAKVKDITSNENNLYIILGSDHNYRVVRYYLK